MKVLGIAWEVYTPELKGILVRDLLSFKGLWPDLALELCSSQDELEKAKEWLQPVLNLTDIKIVNGKDPSVWKVYFYKDEPQLPPYASNIFRKNMLTPHQRKKAKLLKGAERYPSLYRASDHRMVPPGMSININKIPPRRNQNAPYTLPMNYFYSPFL